MDRLVRVVPHNPHKKKISSKQQFSERKWPVDARGQRRIDALLLER